MLQKDGENITKNIKEIFEDDFKFINKRTKTVTFKLVNSIYNGKDKTPRSYHIETSYISRDHDSGDTSEYRYYKNSRQTLTGGLPQQMFTPEFVSFSQRGDISINIGESGTDNLDLLAFFLNHPRLAKSKSGIQTSIEDRCKKNPSLFLGMTEVNEAVMMRANIQKGVDQGFLSLNSLRDKWILSNKDSGESSKLATVRKLENPTDALVYWFNNTDNSDTYGKLMELLTGKPVKRSNKPEEVKNSEPSELEIKLKLAEAENEKLRLQKEKAEAELEKAKLLSTDKKKKKVAS